MPPMKFIFEDRDRVHHYVFACRDHSWIQPYFNRLINNRLLRRLPSGWSPNLLTFAGHSMSWLAFTLICLDRFGPALPISHATVFSIAIGLMFAYCICDSLDGMYARYWQVETPLGDFYDHWLDCFAGFTLPVSLFLALDAPPYLIALLVMCFGFGWTANNLERRENRALVLPAFGAMEGNFLVLGIFSGVTLAPSLVLASESPIYLLIAIGCLGFVNAGWSAVANMRGGKTGLYCALLGIAPVLAWSALVAEQGGEQWLYGLLIGAALVLKFNADILRNTLLGTVYKPNDWFVAIAGALLLAVHIAWPGHGIAENLLLALLAIWAVGMCIVLFSHTTWFCRKELGIRVFSLSPRQRQAVASAMGETAE